MSCAEFADYAAELALGTLEGEHRAAALAHADSCPTCRALLQDLSLTTDALLQLAPAAEPPLGFESRLFEAIHTTRPPVAKRRRWPVPVGVAAAVVAIAASFGVGELVASSPSSSPVAVANLVGGGESHGQVLVSSGKHPWVFVMVSDLGSVDHVDCTVTLADGRVVKVGTFEVNRGYGGWAVPLSVSAGQLRSAHLVAADGTTLASATFHG